MASAEDRELRRHALRYIARTEDGKQVSRILYMQLVDYGHRLTWMEFDRLIAYLERAGLVTVSWLQPEIDRSRVLTITQRGYDVVDGTVVEPGVMPPARGEI